MLWLNWTLLIGSAALLTGLALWSMASTRGQGESGFLVVGNSLGPFVGAATIVATGYSGFVFIGSPGVAYKYGSLELFANIFYTPAFVVATLFFAHFLRRRADQLGSRTIPEYTAQIHAGARAGRTLQALTAIISIVLLAVFLITQIKAIGLLVSGWLGLSVETAALLITVLVIAYTMLGGLRAVAWTDAVMVTGMVVGSCIIAYVVFVETGLGELITALNRVDPALANPGSGAPYGDSPGSAFLLFPYAFLYATALPFMAVRFLAFKPEVKLHKVGLWVAILGLLLNFTPLAGLYARAFLGPLEQPDQAMPMFLQNALHPVAASFITLFILFAMKSTANSLMHTVATAVSHDLRTAVFGPERFSRQGAMWINRGAVVLVGLGAFLAMAYLPTFMVLWLGILGNGTLMAALFGPVFVSTFWRGNASGAFASLVTGFATSAYCLLGTDIGWVQGPLLGCLVSAVTYWGVSQLTQERTPQRVAVDT